jgi:hypothetical protein
MSGLGNQAALYFQITAVDHFYYSAVANALFGRNAVIFSTGVKHR